MADVPNESMIPKVKVYSEIIDSDVLLDGTATMNGRVKNPKEFAWIQKYMKQNPGKYTRQLLSKMRHCGMERPEFVPVDEWDAAGRHPQPVDSLVFYMKAWGLHPREIAKSLNKSEALISTLLRTDEAKRKIAKIQKELWGRDPKRRIKEMLPKALNIAEEIMEDPMVKPGVRLNAAQDILDRGMGKPTQTVELGETSVRGIFDMLDRLEKTKGFVNIPEEIIDAEYSTGDATDLRALEDKQDEDEDKDKIDEWVEENLCKKSSHGSNP